LSNEQNQKNLASDRARRVLIVDDNVDAADTLADLASEWGHETRSANSGLEALLIASAFQPDVVLLDIGLPEMDGYAVARKMRADRSLDRCVLIALTGYGQPQDRERSLAAGFDLHLLKPVDIDKLESVLKEAQRASNVGPARTTSGE
jgi:CheY-like chemotaxis protein